MEREYSIFPVWYLLVGDLPWVLDAFVLHAIRNLNDYLLDMVD